ncbi:MAG: hypothetical protein HYR84_05060 [Planctomycetes bacterium]|nr:hypothetical protein [Planctomycetota bacterium]
MRSYLRYAVLGLLALAVASPSGAGGLKQPLVPETCGDHGTNVHFEKNAKDAATKALKAQKLVLVIHISGYFEEPDYT